MKYFILCFILFAVFIPAQGKLEKWGKAEISYSDNKSESSREYSYKDEGFPGVVSKTFIMAYWFFISDVDGDNCPFHPSCSSFFLDAVKETDTLQGTLLFADRFTRDLNIVNRGQKYSILNNGKYYDPPGKYILKN